LDDDTGFTTIGGLVVIATCDTIEVTGCELPPAAVVAFECEVRGGTLYPPVVVIIGDTFAWRVSSKPEIGQRV